METEVISRSIQDDIDTTIHWEFVDNEKNQWGAIRDGEHWCCLYADRADEIHEIELFTGTAQYANGRTVTWFESFRVVSTSAHEIITSDYAREAIGFWRNSPDQDCFILQQYLDEPGRMRWATVVERRNGRVLRHIKKEAEE